MLTLPLNSAESNLSLTGGKGHNLSILSRGGISVPGGFVVTTSAYHEFVNQNNKKLLTKIEATLTSHVDELDEASAIIQAEFRKQKFSTKLRNEIAERLSELDPQVNLAIRSSAPCEDMPDASFAGQHDTYLNIPHSQVEENIVECFASLFTPRAISYRKRNNLSEVDAGMAVVCQCMASNQTASGVLFTANPLTGRRNESALEAIPGLGEALVSGITEPDRYVVSRKNGEMTIKDKRIGAKSKTILAADGGGVKEETSLAASCEVLTDEEVKSFIDLGQNVQDLYGKPQDIEWTKSADGKFSVVQSRPITTLFPIPNVSMHPLQVFFSFNSVQGIIEPIYPAGQEAIRRGVLGGLLRWITWGRHGNTGEFIQTVGERLYINITNVLQNTLGRKILTTAMTGIDPASAMAIEELIEEDELEINSGVGPFFLIRLVSLYSLIMPRIIMSVLFPTWMRDRLYRRTEKIVESVEEKVSNANASGLSALVDVQIDVLQSSFRTMMPHILPRIGAGLAPLAILGKLSAHLPNGKDLVLTITRALPHNITTEMDLKLWSAAKVIQSDYKSLHHFKSTDADRLALEYLHGELPDVAQDAVSLFMSEYGMRGLYEIDFGRPRWREDPAPLMNTLKSYVEINGDHAPDKVFANGEKVADAAITELGKQLNKPRLVSFLANRARQLAGLRELPKFTAIRMMGIIRAKMLIEGEKLVSIGALEDAKDLFYLETFEIKALVNDELADCKRIIIERKAAMAQESKRTRLPRVIASDGFAYFGGTAKIVEGANVFSGEPVSPGVYEGRIRVVHDPSKTKMTQGEILCCHGTDPSWTPLFLSSGALVMEVGGLMTHGSVVAREYGIPAVVGLEKVTERLTTGQLVRVDGSSGTIEVLE